MAHIKYIYCTSRFEQDMFCVASVLLRSRRLSKHALRHRRQRVSRAWKPTDILKGHSAPLLTTEQKTYLIFTAKIEPKVSYEKLIPVYQSKYS